ncbi:MAG: SsrA-binding protein [Chitinophagaceae bacterium]|nr:SsrA-binding protein [Chitinophagaceae bacterium]
MELKNRSAFHEYAFDDQLVAGMVLAGTEVKSIREGKVSFSDAYCFFHKGELWIKGLHIAEYKFGTANNHMAVHDRKLLLNKKELKKWEAKLKEKGYTVIPLKIFFNEKNIAKMEIGLGRGKKLHDKRETIRNRDVEREMKRYVK